MEVIKSIFVFFIIFSLTSCHLLPEDSVTDDAEQLNREKRDNFLDSILKSIPFFNVRPSENVQQENDAGSDDDEEDDMEADKMLFAILPSTRLATYSTALAAAPTSLMSSVNSVAKETDGATSHIHNAPTLFYTTVSTLSLSNTPQLTSASPYISIIPSPYVSESLFTIDQMNMTIFPTKTVAMTDKLQSSVMAAKLELTSAMTYASASSIAGMPASSNNIKPSNVETMTISPSADLVTEPVIKMMIMSAENPMGMQEFGPRLPNERGYGDTLGKNYYLACSSTSILSV